MDMEKVGHLLNTQCFVIKKCIHWGQFSYTQFRMDLQVIQIVRTQNLNLKVSFNNNSNTVYEFLPCIDHYNQIIRMSKIYNVQWLALFLSVDCTNIMSQKHLPRQQHDDRSQRCKKWGINYVIKYCLRQWYSNYCIVAVLRKMKWNEDDGTISEISDNVSSSVYVVF